jgi:hypothetical protein
MRMAQLVSCFFMDSAQHMQQQCGQCLMQAQFECSLPKTISHSCTSGLFSCGQTPVARHRAPVKMCFWFCRRLAALSRTTSRCLGTPRILSALPAARRMPTARQCRQGSDTPLEYDRYPRTAFELALSVADVIYTARALQPVLCACS